MNHNTTENEVLSLASIFAEMTDQRKPKGIRYEFQALLILLSVAKLVKWLQKVKMFHRIFINYLILLGLS